MFILNIEEVQYCKAVREVGQQKELVKAIIYRGSLFSKVKSYAKDEIELAIKECREQFLDNEDKQIQTLLIKEELRVGLWCQDERLKVAKFKKSESDSIKDTIASKKVDLVDNLDVIVTKMRSVGGLEIKTRPYKLKLYSRCFIGSEAVAWMIKHLQISKEESIALGQKLIDQKIIHHVTDEHSFKNEALFYRFYEDEGKSVWTDKL